MVLTVDQKELSAGKLSDTHVKRAVEAIRIEGYVVLENIVNHEHLDIFRERMDADSQKLINAEKWGGAGMLKGHLQQGPPPFAPFIFKDIVANPYVIQVTKELLGAGVYNNFYNGNTNCPGSGTQPLHRLKFGHFGTFRLRCPQAMLSLCENRCVFSVSLFFQSKSQKIPLCRAASGDKLHATLV